MDEETTRLIPVAKSYSIKELTGFWGKWFRVPPGKLGVILHKDGICSTFFPGKRPVIRPFERLTQRESGIRIGYIPQGPFSLPARFEAIKTGDAEFIDIQMVLQLKVIDPKIFFPMVVVPVGELIEFPDFGKVLIRDKIWQVMNHYERDDILRRIPTDKLVKEIVETIALCFTGVGLQLMDIPLVLIERSEDRLIKEEELIELQAKVEEKQQAPDLEKDVESDLVENIANTVLPESASLRFRKGKPFSEVIDNLQHLRNLQSSHKQHWLLRSLINPVSTEIDPKTKNAIKRWRSLEINWILILLLIGVAISYLIYRFHLNFKSAEIVGFLVGIWGLIISFILNSLKKLVEKSEAILLRSSPFSDLENVRLVKLEDRREVDRLVRGQSANEVKRTLEVISETRGVVYRAGNTELALQIKEFERELEDRKSKFNDLSYGIPFYLSQAMVTDSDWKIELDKEEEILDQLKEMEILAENFRIAAPAVELADLKKIEKHLLAVENLFYSRTRIN
jgi:hypothetical protein